MWSRFLIRIFCCCCSVTELCPTLWGLMDYITPGILITCLPGLFLLLLLLLSHFSRIRLCATPSLGFTRQEHWSGLPFPSPVHESEKWKWSRSVVSDPQRLHGLQPSRLLCPWDFPGKSTGAGCHCFLRVVPPNLPIQSPPASQFKC